MPHNILNTTGVKDKTHSADRFKDTSLPAKPAVETTPKTKPLKPMKTTLLYALVASAALSLTACYKTYTCKCTSATSSSEGQIKAVSKTRAQKFCEKKNCSNGTAEVY